MQHEMREEWAEAQEVLDSIIEEDEANSSARKRKIAIARYGMEISLNQCCGPGMILYRSGSSP
jgi:transcription elongation factor GreA-like protein